MIVYGVAASVDATAPVDVFRFAVRHRWHRASRPPAPASTRRQVYPSATKSKE